MNLLTTLMAFLIALGVLIFVHEYGHYRVAKWCGVKVLRFSLGFGRPILRWIHGPDKTEWMISAIPFGGYVKMLDERESDQVIDTAELHRAFNRQSVTKRFAIVLAGPMANLLLAVLLYSLLNLYGTDEPSARLAAPIPQSIVEQAGFIGSEKIVEIVGANNKAEPVRSWNDLRWQLLGHVVDKEKITLYAELGNESKKPYVLDFSQFDGSDLEGDYMRRLGFELAKPEAVFGEVVAGSAAAAAGFKKDDKVLSVDGTPILYGTDLVNLIRQHPEQAMQFEIERLVGSTVTRLTLTVTPKAVIDESQPDKKIGRIGAVIGRLDMVKVAYDPMQSVARAISKTWDMSLFSIRMMGKMLTGSVSWRNLSGPVTIADYAGQSARLGLSYYLGFMALISISLGVLNLMPIPVLDGGHLVYYTIEFLLGKPIPDIWLERFQKIGLFFIIGMMSLAMFNDLSKLLG